MVNAYESILKCKSLELIDHLKKLHLIEVFKPVIDEFPLLYSGVIKFVLKGYSMESDMLLTTGNSWVNIYKKIYEDSGLPNDKELFDQVANLKSDAVRDSIEKWMQLCDNESWTQYIYYRDLRKEFLQLSKTAEKSKEKMDAILYSKELLAMMEEAKAGFIENSPTLKSSVEALNKATPKQKETLGPQHYAK